MRNRTDLHKYQIGIVILNYISWQDTISCIESIQTTCSLVWHVYVVDNASPNESFVNLQKKYHNDEKVNVILNIENRGYAAGNNVGIRCAMQDGCETILVSNSDIQFRSETIEKLYTCLQTTHTIGVVGPRIKDMKGEDQWGYKLKQVSLKDKYIHQTILKYFMLSYYVETKSYSSRASLQLIDVFSVSGCCFCMSREFVSLALPLDENTFLGSEEQILGIQAQKHGFKISVLPSAEVLHYHRGSTKNTSGFSEMQFYFSEIYYCRSYLKESFINILPLFLYRSIRFISKSFFSHDYSKFLGQFIKEGWKRLRSASGLIDYRRR